MGDEAPLRQRHVVARNHECFVGLGESHYDVLDGFRLGPANPGDFLDQQAHKDGFAEPFEHKRHGLSERAAHRIGFGRGRGPPAFVPVILLGHVFNRKTKRNNHRD